MSDHHVVVTPGADRLLVFCSCDPQHPLVRGAVAAPLELGYLADVADAHIQRAERAPAR